MSGARLRAWWRRNRWGLLALPLLTVALVLASGYRVDRFWDPYHPTEPVPGVAGQPLTFTDTLEDRTGEIPVELSITAGPTRQVQAYRDAQGQTLFFPVETGTVVWQTDLTITADPDTVLTSCTARLVDEQERSTTYSVSYPGPDLPISPCVPDATPGPAADLGFGAVDSTGPRPETYTVPVIFRTSADFVPARLDLAWSTPRYAAITLDVEAPR